MPGVRITAIRGSTSDSHRLGNLTQLTVYFQMRALIKFPGRDMPQVVG